MLPNFKQYSLKTTALAICLASSGVMVTNYMNVSFSSFPLVIVLFYLTSLVIFYLIKTISAARPQRFIPLYTLISGAKLLFYAFSLLIFMFVFRSQALPIAICFGLSYLSFTLLEIYCVIKEIK